MRKSKKPQVRVLDDHKFTIILDIRYKTFENLVTESIYLFHGAEWLITIHSDRVDLLTNVELLFEQKNKKVMDATIDALYYNILTEITSRYEQLLTSVELTISYFGHKSLKKRATKKILEQLDTLTRQIILLRRHFWQARDIMNFLTHTEKDKDEIRYLQIAYDDTYQLIELVESFRDTINSTRDLYTANLSMQMNETMRTHNLYGHSPATNPYCWNLWCEWTRLDQYWQYTNRIFDCHYHNDYHGRLTILVFQA